MSFQFYITDIHPLFPHIDAACALLPAARQERIHRCSRETARLQLLAAGLLLRHVLGITEETPLLYTPQGKPYLKHGPCFNLSHSGQFAALAVSDQPVGLDLQDMTHNPSPQLANRWFTAEEAAWIHEQPDRFFHVWTRKESVVKALGLGLAALPMHTFSVLEPTLTIQGTTLHLVTEKQDTMMLSVAAQSPLIPPLSPIFLSPEQLLKEIPLPYNKVK